jgi:hypothetical protein
VSRFAALQPLPATALTLPSRPLACVHVFWFVFIVLFCVFFLQTVAIKVISHSESGLLAGGGQGLADAEVRCAVA